MLRMTDRPTWPQLFTEDVKQEIVSHQTASFLEASTLLGSGKATSLINSGIVSSIPGLSALSDETLKRGPVSERP